MKTANLAKKGEVEKTPKIKIQDLLAKDENGVPSIIWLIAHNELSHIPKHLLTHKVLSQNDLEGRSAYHLAAKWGQFEHIPKKLITLEILKESDIEKETTWAILIRKHQLNDILPFIDGLIDEKDSGNESFLHLCASTGQLYQVPKEYLTKDRIFNTVKRTNENVIDYAAYFGCLNQIPEEFINEDSMNLRNTVKETPLHIAAEAGTLHLVPKRFLTQENLEKEDNWGTVFHKAAINCNLDTFPKEFLTEKNLLLRSKNSNMNILYILAREHCESSDPDKREKAGKQLTNLVSILSTKNLNSLKNELEIENWLPAVTITKKEALKRKLFKKIQRKANTIEI